MTGSDDVLDAALRQNGVLRVDTIEELFDMAEVLAKQPLPAGPRLAILTNAGGPGALATDALVLGGGTLPTLTQDTLQKLDAVLPAHWSHHNPVDVLGDADAARFTQALQIVSSDANVDGVLAILTPQSMTKPSEIAREVAELAATNALPLLASWMGAESVREGRAILNSARIPTYDYPDEAARAFVRMHEHHTRLHWLKDTQEALANRSPRSPATLPTKSGLLSEAEAKRILAEAGIPVVETIEARTEDEAAELAARLGFPVVLKLLSPTITHKSDVGGVQLDLRDEAAVHAAWRAIRANVPAEAFAGVTVQRMMQEKGVELILGVSRDAQFGPVLLFGAGGTLVEVWKDRALALPPLNRAMARRLIAQTRISRVLQGVRGQAAVHVEALEEAIVRFSLLIAAEPRILEADINPLVATPSGVVALDARMVLS
jgi:acetyltransferase